jgi:lipopolysaccharide/colanic/teichoic acid biosynthesis glycosyltransferase
VVGAGGGNALSPVLDRALAALLLVLSAPLLAVVAAAIRLESRGPALYRQRRIGRHGEPFEMLKLRTMVWGAENLGAGIEVEEGDPRITRVGAWLRRLSLDEVPNLVNVLRGEMALVGPRPTIQAQVEQYTDRQRRRLDVRPGITGWAQVNGRASLPWHERIELDVWYVDHRSTALDLEILARSIGLLLSGRGLYRGETGGWRPDAPPTGAAHVAAPAFPRPRNPGAGRRPRWRRLRRSPRGRSRRSG